MSTRNSQRDERLAYPEDGAIRGEQDLSPAQRELLRDLRESLREMARGEMLPARETLQQIERELEEEDDADRLDTDIQVFAQEAGEKIPPRP